MLKSIFVVPEQSTLCAVGGLFVAHFVLVSAEKDDWFCVCVCVCVFVCLQSADCTSISSDTFSLQFVPTPLFPQSNGILILNVCMCNVFIYVCLCVYIYIYICACMYV